MSLYIGIDPGASGAIAFIDEHIESAEVYDFDDDYALILLRQYAVEGNRPIHAVLEKVSAMPKQGVVSMFNFGVNFGIWQGRLQTLQIPFDLMTPQKWKAKVMDSVTLYKTVKKKNKETGKVTHEKVVDKERTSLRRAKMLFPELVERLQRVKDNGRADALLIARYCQLRYGRADGENKRPKRTRRVRRGFIA